MLLWKIFFLHIKRLHFHKCLKNMFLLSHIDSCTELGKICISIFTISPQLLTLTIWSLKNKIKTFFFAVPIKSKIENWIISLYENVILVKLDKLLAALTYFFYFLTLFPKITNLGLIIMLQVNYFLNLCKWANNCENI